MSRKVIIRQNPAENDPYVELLVKYESVSNENSVLWGREEANLKEIERLSAALAKIEKAHNDHTYGVNKVYFGSGYMTPVYGAYPTTGPAMRSHIDIRLDRITQDSFDVSASGMFVVPHMTQTIFVNDVLTLTFPITLAFS